jgi:glycosyltransferase involved in cell wall biosynthesis
MRIAVYHNLPSGGAKRTLYESMKRLSQRHSLDIYTLDTADKEFCDLSEFSNAEFVYHFSPAKLFQSPLGRLNQIQRWLDLQRLDHLARQIARNIDDGGYDVVFAQPCMWTQAPLVLRYLKISAIYYCHEPPRHLYESPYGIVGSKLSTYRALLDHADPFLWLYRTTGHRFDKLATSSANLVLVNSLFIRDRVKQIYEIEPVICYHGVDTDVFYPRVKKGVQNYVLSVGAIQPHKGYDFLIDSFSYIEKRIRPSLHLVGNMKNSDELDALQALAKLKDVDLHIEVGVDQNTLIQKYNDAILVVYAPYNEPFGLVPLEAMACGKPVVGIDEGGVKETIIHGITGLLVERDPFNFGKAIQSLLEDPTLAEQYGTNGRKHVLENWTWEKSTADIERRLHEVVQ